MSTAAKYAACLLLAVAGVALIFNDKLSGLVFPAGSPSRVYVVVETAEMPKLPAQQLAWINSAKFHSACLTAGFEFGRLDPDVTVSGDKPAAEVSQVIAQATTSGLPRLVVKTSTGRFRDYPLPKDEAAARSLLGL